MKKTDSIPFLTDDGTEVEFGILEQTTINGRNYLLVSEEETAGEEDTIVYIMRETSDSDSDLASYEIVEDEDELESVSKVFEQLMEDLDIEVE
ncbi:MAG: DUF1292 domain-containing protein [Eubacterium sp.]|nr:DUF1292 domain-containing protein [Eubacterium sp.]